MVDARLRGSRVHAGGRRRHPVVRDWTWAGAGAGAAVPALPRTPRRTSRPRSCGSSSSTPARAVSSCRSSDLGMRRWLLRSLPRRGRWSTTMSCARLWARRSRRRRRGRAPDRPRRLAVLVGGGRRFRRAARARGAGRPGAAPPAEVAGRARRGVAGAPGVPAVGVLRHGVPRDAAGRGIYVRAAALLGARAGGCGGTASMGCRTRGSRGGRLRWWGRLVLRRACGS